MAPNNFREQCDLALNKSKDLKDSAFDVLYFDLMSLKSMTMHETFLLDFKSNPRKKSEYEPSALFWFVASYFSENKTGIVSELAIVIKIINTLENLDPYENKDDLLKLHILLYIYQQDKGKANVVFNYNKSTEFISLWGKEEHKT